MNNEMEAPCPCQNCGEWFDLEDGYRSEKWYLNIVICETCHDIEDKEIAIDEEIEESEGYLDDAVFTINEHIEVLRKNKKPPIVFFTTEALYPKNPKNDLQKKYLKMIKGYSNRLVLGYEALLKDLEKDLKLLSDEFPSCKPITISNGRDVYENGMIILYAKNIPDEFGQLLVLNPVRNYKF